MYPNSTKRAQNPIEGVKETNDIAIKRLKNLMKSHLYPRKWFFDEKKGILEF